MYLTFEKSIRSLQIEVLCHLNFRLCKCGAPWAVYPFAYAHRASGKLIEARKQEARSRLIHPPPPRRGHFLLVDGGSGMLRLVLDEHRLDRLSSGEQKRDAFAAN
jgi:hypothetical protein